MGLLISAGQKPPSGNAFSETKNVFIAIEV